MPTVQSTLPVKSIERKILFLRGQKVMLDADLAELYEIETRILVRAVRRNLERFPDDFMFQLNNQEVAILRSQFGISKPWGGRRYLPYVFTEYGVAMLSSVLNSKKAIAVNIEIMRTFGRLRQILASHKDLGSKLEKLEGRVRDHDESIQSLIQAIQQLMAPPTIPPKRKIGF